MISIDSDVLRSLTAVADTASQEMTSGAEKLNQVTVHDDWNCAERDIINEHIVTMKQKTKALQNKTQSFLDLLRTTADRFDAADSSINLSFVNLQKTISDSMSIATESTMAATKTMSEYLAQILSRHKLNDFHAGYTIHNLDTPMRILRYADIDFSKLSKGE